VRSKIVADLKKMREKRRHKKMWYKGVTQPAVHKETLFVPKKKQPFKMLPRSSRSAAAGLYKSATQPWSQSITNSKAKTYLTNVSK